jgi:hypothetical protein
MDQGGTGHNIPTFGVPKQVAWRDVPFIVAAGLPLMLFWFTAIGAVLDVLGLSIAEDTWVSGPLTLAAIGLGPALAYYFGRALVLSGIARGFGCLALVVFWVLVLLVSGGTGQLGGVVAGLLVMGAVAWLLWRRIRRRQGLGPTTPAPPG